MDLRQSKLTKEEWCNLEVPVSHLEKRILKMIYDSWENPNIQYNDAQTLMTVMKINENKDKFHQYFYENYFKSSIEKLIKKYDIMGFEISKKVKKINIKKKDKIRIQNINKKIESIKDDIYEYLLIKIIKKYLTYKKNKDKKKLYYYYISSYLLKNTIIDLNYIVKSFVELILNIDKHSLRYIDIIKNSQEYIEQNKILLKYRDIRLYEHQKK